MEWILAFTVLVTLALLWWQQQKHNQLQQQNNRELSQLMASNASLKAENQHLNQQLHAQSTQAAAHEKRLRTDFELLANQILEKQTGKLTQTNAERLEALLNPLRQNLQHYQQRVEAGLKSTTELQAHLNNLQQLNQKLSTEAHNLTEALKGSSKMQGDWGEMVLETILQNAGLQPNIHYTTQQTTDGLRPDVTLKLPGQRYIIIDAKVSLKAYAQYAQATDASQKTQLLKEHIKSIKNHIANLKSKNYAAIHGNQSPDHVFLFMPIEPAFLLAVQAEPELWFSAFKNNVVLLSPTNLMAVMRIVEEIWKQDKINQNALQIADEAGKLYDKFEGFVADLTQVGKHISKAQDSYEQAYKKLETGRGNLISRVEKLKELGAKANKQLPDADA